MASEETIADRLRSSLEHEFVGRRDELGYFADWLAGETSEQVVFVAAPGGVGKTTLLRRVEGIAADHGYATAYVLCEGLTPNPPDFRNELGFALGTDRTPGWSPRCGRLSRR